MNQTGMEQVHYVPIDQEVPPDAIAHGNWILAGDNLARLKEIPDNSIGLVYTDPPFNTGKKQQKKQIKSIKDLDGDRTGFGEHRYRTILESSMAYEDSFDDFLGFLLPRVEECWRILHDTGSLYIHLDYREVHYIKVALDHLLGRQHFLNEIIWAYDFGGRPKRKWPAKHDTILVYVKNPDTYWFDQDSVERIPYMAPGLVGKEKAAKGKVPTDVWWHTIVGTASKEKTGYPTQKPLGVVRRILQASAPPGLPVLDCFAGSGTLGAAALHEERRFVLIDQNSEALEVMKKRLI